MATNPTPTFSQYPDGDVMFSINTDYTDACRVSISTDALVQTVHLDHDMSRTLGTAIIGATASPTGWLEHSIDSVPTHFDGGVDALGLVVDDGVAMITIGVLTYEFDAYDADVVDLAVRLIAFAGPALAATEA